VQSSFLRPVSHGFRSDVQVWWVDLDAYAKAVAMDRLPAKDHVRAARMVAGRDEPRYLASRHALRYVLGTVLERPPEDLVLEPDLFGKPQLKDEDRLHFNLSHSGHECLIGVTRSLAIGVDIEILRRVPDADALARSHFTPREQGEWVRVTGPLRDRAFLTCWTRKEACVKALGVGFLARPAIIEVGCAEAERMVGIPPGTTRFEVQVVSLRQPTGSVAAVAVTLPEATVHARDFFRNETQQPRPPLG